MAEISENWKNKKYVVTPKKNPALMTQIEALEWELESDKVRYAAIKEPKLAKIKAGYEQRIEKIKEELEDLKNPTKVAEALDAKTKEEDLEGSAVVAVNQKDASAKSLGDNGINPLLAGELNKEEKKKRPKPLAPPSE